MFYLNFPFSLIFITVEYKGDDIMIPKNTAVLVERQPLQAKAPENWI